MEEHLALNRASWDEKVPAHVASPDYAVQRLTGDADALSGVVAFDQPLLGDISGLRGVHLQCHIGTDTVSLAKLGTRFVLQGGTQHNLAAVKAQVDFIRARFKGTGIEPRIIVHPHCGESGAIGCAG